MFDLTCLIIELKTFLAMCQVFEEQERVYGIKRITIKRFFGHICTNELVTNKKLPDEQPTWYLIAPVYGWQDTIDQTVPTGFFKFVTGIIQAFST